MKQNLRKFPKKHIERCMEKFEKHVSKILRNHLFKNTQDSYFLFIWFLNAKKFSTSKTPLSS